MSSKDKLTVESIDGARPSPPTPRRSVSFGVEDSIAPAPLSSEELSNAINATPGVAGMSTSAFAANSTAMAPAGSSSSSANPSPATLRSALKPSASAYKKLPPPEQYQHRDPLLRRLRLVDEYGKPVNLKQKFGSDVKCIGFYFSSQWAGQPLKEYHKTITEFCLRHPHEFKIIYVSVDVDEQWYKAGIKGKPWVSMVWNDGSSPPAGSEDKKKASKVGAASEDDADVGSAGRATLHNGEDFLLGGEPDIDESLSHSDTSGEAYLRPFSRVHLASKLNIIAAPTLCVYHLPSGKMLDRNVRMTKLRPGQEESAWERWKNGEKTASAGFLDAAQQRPMTIIMLVLSILYYLWVRATGPEYNFLQQGMLQLADRFSPSHANSLNLQQGASPAGPPPAAPEF